MLGMALLKSKKKVGNCAKVHGWRDERRREKILMLVNVPHFDDYKIWRV